MRWEKLKNYKCPKDNALLEDRGKVHGCTNCDFVITKGRFEEIVNDRYKPRRFESEEDRLSELNNLEI